MVTEIRTVFAYGSGEGLTGKGHDGTFWSDGNVLFCDWHDCYTGVCSCQNPSNCTLKSCVFYFIKLYKKPIILLPLLCLCLFNS